MFWGLGAKANYHVTQQIGAGVLKKISQIAIGADDSIYALEKSGKVTLFSPSGDLIRSFNVGFNNTEAITISPDGEVYILSTLTKKKKVKVGARMRTVQIPTGVQCIVFDAQGKKIKSFELKNLKSAKTARIIKGTLVVADLTAKSIVFMDLETGKETGRIKKGLRLCCGIFDFCEGPNQTLAVANLGAFKVQHFDMTGKLLLEFGKRGRAMDDFQGCCNPVSVGYLSDERIVTVEKDPTRIKIYDAAGKNAVKIDGVEELVEGCSFIPIAIDSQNNIYLGANAKNYIVKCEP